jgi:uncharacterized protein YggE
VSGLFESRWSRIVLGAAVLVVAVGGAAAGATLAAGSGTPAGAVAGPRCGAGAPKVTVTGTGAVSVTPNLLTMSLDVHTTGPQASAALAKNDATTAAVLHALSAGGVAAKDLQTTDLTIQPNYANTGTAVTGYGVDNTVVAKIRKFSTAGTLIDAAVAAGGNDTRIDSLSFSLTRPLDAQARARNMAVRQAVGHARAIAASSSERLGGICSIHDDTTTSTTSPPIPYATFGRAAAPSNTPVSAGSQTVTSRVTIVFALG